MYLFKREGAAANTLSAGALMVTRANDTSESGVLLPIVQVLYSVESAGLRGVGRSVRPTLCGAAHFAPVEHQQSKARAPL